MLRYRPWGRTAAPRVLALTIGSIRTLSRRRRLRPALGFAVEAQPGLAAQLRAHLALDDAARVAWHAPLEGENLLASSADLPARWHALAARKLVPTWLRYLR
jgi:hypothetical protein